MAVFGLLVVRVCVWSERLLTLLGAELCFPQPSLSRVSFHSYGQLGHHLRTCANKQPFNKCVQHNVNKYYYGRLLTTSHKTAAEKVLTKRTFSGGCPRESGKIAVASAAQEPAVYEVRLGNSLNSGQKIHPGEFVCGEGVQ